MINTSVDIGPKISVQGEVEFKKSLKQLNTEVKAHAAELKALAAQYDKDDKSVEYLTQKQKILDSTLKTSQQRVAALSDEYGKQKDKLQVLARRLQEAEAKNGAGSEAALKAEKAYQRQAVKVNDLSVKLNNAKADMAAAEQATKANGEAVDKATNKYQKLKTALAETDTKLDNFTGKMEAAGSKISDLGGKLTIGVTTPLVTAATAATTLATTAETSFAKVSTIFDDTVMSADKLESEVLAASDSTGIAVADLNEALYSSVSAGVDSANALQFTVQMAKLAKGGFTDTAKAVDVVTTVINAYGKSADEATDIADRLITTQNLGKTTVDELASSLGKVIPTAYSVGVGFDDVSTAMAVLTKNGIATAEAGTYYNSMLNELGKSGTNADKALKAIAGEGFKDLVNDGKPVTDILIMLRDYAEESELSLSDMFGSAEASKAALTLIKNNGAEYNEILGQMQDSAGATQSAFDKMDSTSAAKMQKELNKLKNIGVDMGNKLLPIVNKGLDLADDLLGKYDNLSDDNKDLAVQVGAVAAAAGPALKIVGTGISTLGKLTSKVGTVAKGIAAVTGPAGAVTLGIAAVAVAGVAAYKKIEEHRLDKLIDEQFGNITLSAEEVEDVATRLTTTEWTMKLDAVVEAKTKLDEFEQELSGSIEDIEKLNWKVSIGLELTEEEQNSYLSSVESFIQSGQDYITQQGYTMSLAIDATLGGTSMGEGLSAFANSFIASTLTEAEQLGQELADQINESFANGTFAEDRLKIDEMLNNYKAALDKFNSYKAQAEQQAFATEVGVAFGSGVTKDSLDAVLGKAMDNWSDSVAAAWDSLDITNLTTVALEDKMREAGVGELFIEQVVADFNNAAMSETYSQLGDSFNNTFGVVMTEVVNAFGDDVTSAQEQMPGYLDNFVDTLCTATAEGGTALADAWSDFGTDIEQPSKEAQKAIKDSLEQMAPQKAELEKIRDACLEAGLAVPESVKEGLENIAAMESMCGAGDGVYVQLAKSLADNPDKLAMLMQNENFGKSLDESLAKAIEMYTGWVVDAETGKWTKIKEAEQMSAEEAADMLNVYGAELGESYADGMASAYGLVYQNGKWMVDEAAQGVKSSNSLYNAAVDKAVEAVDGAEAVSAGSVLTAPTVSAINIDVLSALNKAQIVLDNNPLKARIQAASINAIAVGASAALSVVPHATGGIITSPEVSLMGEDGAEAIIPLSDKYRTQAQSLLSEVADIVQYNPYSYSQTAAHTVGAQYNSRAQAAQPTQTIYQFDEGAIHSEVHTQATDPEAVSRAVIKNLTQGVRHKAAAARGGQK